MKKNMPMDITYLFIFFFYATCFTGIILASLDRFSGPVNLYISLGFTFATCLYFKPKFEFHTEHIWLFGLVILCILLRYPMYDSGLGGQDEGLYIHYSKLISEHGSLNFVDDFRNTLSSPLKEIYDHYQPISVVYGGPNRETFTVPFYPLLPLVNATFSFFNVNTALILVAIINFFLFRLILAPYVSKTLLTLSLIFIVFQPHFIFFSRFPVGETLATVFVLSAILMILKMDMLSNTQIFISTFFTLFLYLTVRMNFPIATLFILFGGLRFYLLKNSFADAMKFVFVSGIALYFCILYYDHFHFELLITNIFNTYLPVLRGFLKLHYAVLFIFLTVIVVYFSRKKIIIHKSVAWLKNSRSLPILLFALLILISFPSLIKLTSINQLTPYPFPLVPNFDNIRYHSIFRFLALIGPILVFLFLSRTKLSNFEITLAFLTFILWTVAIQWTPWVPYQYYYSRYFISEFFPTFLLFLLLLARYLKPSVQLPVFILAITYNILFSTTVITGWEREEKGFYSKMDSKFKGQTLIFDKNISAAIIDGFLYMTTANVFVLNLEENEKLAMVAESASQPASIVFSDTHFELAKRHCLNYEKTVFKNYYLSNSGHIFDGYDHQNWRTYLLPTKQGISETNLYIANRDCILKLVRN